MRALDKAGKITKNTDKKWRKKQKFRNFAGPLAKSGDEEMQMRSRKALDETAKNLRAIIDDKDMNLQEAPRKHMTEHFQKFAKMLAI